MNEFFAKFVDGTARLNMDQRWNGWGFDGSQLTREGG